MPVGARSRSSASGLGSLNTAYSVTFSNHPPSATALLVGVLLIWRWRRFGAGLVDARGRRLSRRRRGDRRSRRGLLSPVPLRLRGVAGRAASPCALALVLALAAAVPLVAYAAYAYALTRQPAAAAAATTALRLSGLVLGRAAGHLPGSSLAHASLERPARLRLALLLRRARPLLAHPDHALPRRRHAAPRLRRAAHPHRVEAIALVLAPTAVLVVYYLVTSDNPGGNSYGVRWYCLFIPLLLRLPRRRVRDAHDAASRAPRFWIAYALSVPARAHRRARSLARSRRRYGHWLLVGDRAARARLALSDDGAGSSS